jgi:REP element-mobilizing transposase RayT
VAEEDSLMPTGLKRFQNAESLHFITFSCFHRLPLLQAPEAKETVEAILEQTRARHAAQVYAYVLMPEHIHLLVNEPPGIVLAQFLKAVKQMTSRKLRGRKGAKLLLKQQHRPSGHGRCCRRTNLSLIPGSTKNSQI